MAKLLTMPKRETPFAAYTPGKLVEMPKPRDTEPGPGLSALNYWNEDNLPPYAHMDDGA